MTYDEALRYIDGLLVGQRPQGPDLRLRRMALLLDALDLRSLPFPVVLVAGTKGKGSTSAMLASILQAGGRRVGLYTKPHVSDYRERIRMNAEPISFDALPALVERLAPAVDLVASDPAGRTTYFEGSLALALLAFAEASADLAVIEVGVGGRHDAANALEPVLSVITPISRDHTETLGETVDAIARHKAGIMRDGKPVVVAPQEPDADAALDAESQATGARIVRVVAEAAWTQGEPGNGGHTFALRTRRTDYGRLRLGMQGPHQTVNAATAVVASEVLTVSPLLTAPARGVSRGEVAFRGISIEAVSRGLSAAVLPGRFEVLPGAPALVLDVAHNPASMRALRAALDMYFPGRPIVLVFGMIASHDPAESLAPIADRVRVAVMTTAAHQRALQAEALAAIARRHVDQVEVVADRQAAVARALGIADLDEVVCVTGSVFVVSDVRDVLIARRGAETTQRSYVG